MAWRRERTLQMSVVVTLVDLETSTFEPVLAVSPMGVRLWWVQPTGLEKIRIAIFTFLKRHSEPPQVPVTKPDSSQS
jgi:hypothetical protein